MGGGLPSWIQALLSVLKPPDRIFKLMVLVHQECCYIL